MSWEARAIGNAAVDVQWLEMHVVDKETAGSIDAIAGGDGRWAHFGRHDDIGQKFVAAWRGLRESVR